MALPPEPLEEVLPQANAAVVAKVGEILFRAEQDFIPDVGDTDVVDVPRDLPLQKVTLQVSEVLFGTLAIAGQTIEVVKPPGDYILRVGVEGPFLLAQKEDNTTEIIGRYGPDTYSLNYLRSALSKRKEN